jgi:hypothetical protein
MTWVELGTADIAATTAKGLCSDGPIVMLVDAYLVTSQTCPVLMWLSFASLNQLMCLWVILRFDL